MFFFFSSRRRHTRLQGDWSSDVCSSDLLRHGKNIGGLRETRGGDGVQLLSRPSRLEGRVSPHVQGPWREGGHLDRFAQHRQPLLHPLWRYHGAARLAREEGCHQYPARRGIPGCPPAQAWGGPSGGPKEARGKGELNQATAWHTPGTEPFVPGCRI